MTTYIEFGQCTDSSLRLTVAAAIPDFLRCYEDASQHTQRSFAADLKRFAEALGERPMDQITGKQIQAYLDNLTSGRAVENQPVAPQTYNRHFGTLRRFFGWLVEQEELERSPMEKLKRRKVGERLPRPMIPEQIKAFFARIDDLRDRALFSLLYRSGVRVGEALSLDIEDLDLAGGTFRLIGKGDQERFGYLSDETTKLIRRYLRERGRPKRGPLFESRQGRLSYAMARTLFKRYADGPENGQSVTIHKLRHTFGSERAGSIDALILRDLMGHKSLRTTAQYSKVSPQATKRAFREFDRQRVG